jgi:SagB-type dehydrogenase family enzyme
MDTPAPLDLVFAYHERTKHQPQRYAASLGYMDWATQPSPFRTYEGAEQIVLDHPPVEAEPTYDQLFSGAALPVSPLTREAISRLFYDSLALSAWKQAPGTSPWSLRVNPSSGALHPTEGYLIAGPVPALSAEPGIYHYAPYSHALERRSALSRSDWAELTRSLPAPCVLVGLTSIYWRESWKYGERAFRYCQHDVGHAIGTLSFAARTLGWQARLLDSISTDDLARLLGVHTQQGAEAEHADCLLVLYPDNATQPPSPAWDLNLAGLTPSFVGQPNRLSKEHHDWPIIDAVGAATRHPGQPLSLPRLLPLSPAGPDRMAPAAQIIRQRRSAVDMDGQTSLPMTSFYQMLERVIPGRHAVPFAVLPWRPSVSLLLFVHRVTGVEPGLHLLVRHPDHEPSLRAHIRQDAAWTRPAGCPANLPLYLLVAGDARRVAKLVSCQQDIAAAGVFAAAMLCEFEPRLHSAGPSFYPRLFWETGLIGQLLYLEAEAAGIRATGIGCFFDDTTHHYAGLEDRAWQDLYHFTLGGPVEDPRLKTIAPYAHLHSIAASA